MSFKYATYFFNFGIVPIGPWILRFLVESTRFRARCMFSAVFFLPHAIAFRKDSILLFRSTHLNVSNKLFLGVLGQLVVPHVLHLIGNGLG